LALLSRVSNCCYCSFSLLSLFLFHVLIVHFSTGLFLSFYVFRAAFSTIVVWLSCPLYVLTAFLCVFVLSGQTKIQIDRQCTCMAHVERENAGARRGATIERFGYTLTDGLTHGRLHTDAANFAPSPAPDVQLSRTLQRNK